MAVAFAPAAVFKQGNTTARTVIRIGKASKWKSAD